MLSLLQGVRPSLLRLVAQRRFTATYAAHRGRVDADVAAWWDIPDKPSKKKKKLQQGEQPEGQEQQQQQQQQQHKSLQPEHRRKDRATPVLQGNRQQQSLKEAKATPLKPLLAPATGGPALATAAKSPVVMPAAAAALQRQLNVARGGPAQPAAPSASSQPPLGQGNQRRGPAGGAQRGGQAPRGGASPGPTPTQQQAELLDDVRAFVVRHGSVMRGGALLPVAGRLAQLVQYVQVVAKKGKRKAGPPKAEVLEELEGLSGWWWEELEVWGRRRLDVERFMAESGRLPRQNSGSQEERRLGKWARVQRQRRAGKMKPPLEAEQAAALEGIAGWQW